MAGFDVNKSDHRGMPSLRNHDGHLQSNLQLMQAIINRVEIPRFTRLIELVRSLSLKAILRTISDG